jgi:carboxymethylenebutenolidase
MAPSFYDPNSPDEQPVPMPSASLETLKENIVLQRPLTRRGTGPGIIIVLPAPNTLEPRSPDAAIPLDPEPVQKWAEEGFVVVGITYSEKASFGVKDGIDALFKVPELDNKERFGVIG